MSCSSFLASFLHRKISSTPNKTSKFIFLRFQMDTFHLNYFPEGRFEKKRLILHIFAKIDPPLCYIHGIAHREHHFRHILLVILHCYILRHMFRVKEDSGRMSSSRCDVIRPVWILTSSFLNSTLLLSASHIVYEETLCSLQSSRKRLIVFFCDPKSSR